MEIKRQEQLLLNRALNNDQRAFTLLMEKYQNAIQSLVYKIVGNKEDAEDITIETFSKAFDNLSDYSNQYAFSTWIFKIASNSAIDFLRKKHISKVSLEQDENIQNSIYFSSNQNPELKLISKQRQDEIKNLLLRLEPNHQRILELRYLKELSYEEIAEHLSISLTNVKVQLHRAKKALSKVLPDINEW